MAYSFKVEKVENGKRGITHRAVIYQDGKQVSAHGTCKGEAVATKEALGVIKFYERQDRRDRASA